MSCLLVAVVVIFLRIRAEAAASSIWSVPAHYVRRAMPSTKTRSSRSRSERMDARRPDAAAEGSVSVRKRDQSDEQKVPRLRAERDQLQRDNEVLKQERASAIAQAEAAQRRSSRAAPEERKSAMGSLNEALETALAQRDETIATIAAAAGRARGCATKRLDAALSRETLAAEAAC